METIPVIPDDITFAVLLTAAGTGIASGLVTGLVALLRASMPVFMSISGAALAFVLSAILYVLAGIAVHVDSLDRGLVVFVAWLTCAASAVGINQVIARGALTK